MLSTYHIYIVFETYQHQYIFERKRKHCFILTMSDKETIGQKRGSMGAKPKMSTSCIQNPSLKSKVALTKEAPKICFAYNFDKNMLPTVISCNVCVKRTSRTQTSQLHLVQCCDCHLFLDIACARISNLDFNILMNEKSMVWFCRSCENNDLKSHRMAQIELLKNQFIEFMSPLQSIVDSQAFKISSLEAVLSESQSKIQSLEKQISSVNGIILKQSFAPRKDSETTTNDLSKRVESFEKHLRANNLILRGVPVVANENLNNVICNAGKFLKMKISESDIDCYRFKSTPLNNHPPPIVVKFGNKALKDDLYGRYLDGLRNHNFLHLPDLGLSAAKVRVYLNHHLTENCMSMFNKARKLVRDKKIQQAFTSYGDVFIRISSDNNQKRKISRMEQLEGEFI